MRAGATAPVRVPCGNGRFLGRAVAACEVHPVQLDPVTGDLILHTGITLTVELAPDPAPPALRARQREMRHLGAELARHAMRGTERPGDTLPDPWQPGTAATLDPGDYAYVIVTSAAQQSAYATYAEWKTAKGVPATAVTVEWIATAYPGRDLGEQIRNFLIEATQQWGTSYVLLGGDQPVVPSRVSWAFDCEAGIYPDENDLYADLYDSDLDGDWDANHNDVFGEIDDAVDLYPDILVGRAPSADLAEASAIVDKFLQYERTPPAGHMMEAFFFAEILWQNPYTDSGLGKDMIAERHFGTAYDPIERQYESLGNESDGSVRAYLDSGPHLANHAGHASYSVMGCGNGYLDRSEASSLTNAPYFFTLYSIGCWAGAFDYDCVGERFLTNASGGAIAFVGNSRYGWGSPGNPGRGYSETFDSDFYGAILTEGETQFGAALAWPKILRVPCAQDGNVYRWHEYQVNLFGDPEMSCHTAPVSTMVLSAPAAMPAGNDDGEIGAGEVIELFVTVHNYGGQACAQVSGTLTESSPEAEVLVSQASFGGVPAGGEATSSTAFVFQVATGCPADQVIAFTLDLDGGGGGSWSVALPLRVVAPGPRLHHYAASELAGNGDTVIDPGETFAITVYVANQGSGNVSPMAATLTSTDPSLTITHGSATTGAPLAAGGVTALAPAFELEVAPTCPATGYCSLDLQLAHDEGTDLDSFLLAIGRPGFEDDMESGAGGWAHTGSNDLWHLTDYRQHSGSQSWYCGTAAHQYQNNVAATLWSPTFVAPEQAQLSFWCYFDVTIYGSDGLFVEVLDDTDWEVLDHLGSGGALDSLTFMCDWAEHSYDLSGLGLAPGSTTQVRFRLVTDGSGTDEGFYIDDVAVLTPGASTGIGGTGELPVAPAPITLSQTAPNPVRYAASWRLFLPATARVAGRIYDPQGRLVRVLVERGMAPGEHAIRWDGRTARGGPAPAGIYFLRMRAGETEVVRKIARVRR